MGAGVGLGLDLDLDLVEGLRLGLVLCIGLDVIVGVRFDPVVEVRLEFVLGFGLCDGENGRGRRLGEADDRRGVRGFRQLVDQLRERARSGDDERALVAECFARSCETLLARVCDRDQRSAVVGGDGADAELVGSLP